MEVWILFGQNIDNNSGELTLLTALILFSWVSGEKYWPKQFFHLFLAFLIVVFVLAMFGINLP